MANPSDITRSARVRGSAFTIFKWRNMDGPIAYLQEVQNRSPAPVAQPVAIQPLNARRPLEIITPTAQVHGVLTLQLIELWNKPVWDHLADLAGSNDLAEIMMRCMNLPDEITVQTIIRPPRGGDVYRITYHGCMVSDVRDDERVAIEEMQSLKTIELWYTHYDFNGRFNPSK